MRTKIAFAAVGILLTVTPVVVAAQTLSSLSDTCSATPTVACLQQEIQLLVQILTQLLAARQHPSTPNPTPPTFPNLQLSAQSVTESTYNFSFNLGSSTSYGYKLDYGDGSSILLCAPNNCFSGPQQTIHGYTTPGTYTATLYANDSSGNTYVAGTVTVTPTSDVSSNDTNQVSITLPTSGSSYTQDQYIPVTVTGSVSRKAYGLLMAYQQVNGNWQSAPLPTAWSIVTPGSYVGPGSFTQSVQNVLFSSNPTLTWPMPPGQWGLQAQMYTFGCGGDDCSPPTNRILATSSIVPITITSSAPQTTPAPTCTLSASPTTVASGQATTLSWTSTNATSARWIPDPSGKDSTPPTGTPNTSGSMSFTPPTILVSSYNPYEFLQVTGPGGTANCSVGLSVVGSEQAAFDNTVFTQGSTPTPTISGTASGVSSVAVTLQNSSTPGVGVVYNSSAQVVNGHWSVTVSPALPTGSYFVYVYDTSAHILVNGGYLNVVASAPTTASCTYTPANMFSGRASTISISGGASACSAWCSSQNLESGATIIGGPAGSSSYSCVYAGSAISSKTDNSSQTANALSAMTSALNALLASLSH